jgi:hypothetical protein
MHTPTRSPGHVLGRALGPRRGRRGTLHERSGPPEPGGLPRGIEGIEGTPFAFLASPRAARILTVLAVGEALADKLPFSPDRISPPAWSDVWPPADWWGGPVRRRGASRGDRSRDRSPRRRGHLLPLLLPRVKTQEKFGVPNWALGLVEDALAEGLGLLALRKS